ncbi:MAG: PP2C family protein-serine/threonine phosphatase [Oscillochloridaceae bacterium umkhey_bin13]
MTASRPSPRSQPTQPRMSQLRYSTVTEQGHRPRNEDAVAATAGDYGDLLAIVADGMGGGIDGKRFSDSAVDRVQATFFSSTATDGATRLAEAVRAALRDLHALRQSDPRYLGSGTTLVCAYVRPLSSGAEVTYLHVGDSPIYYVQAATRTARKLTTDHTYAEALIRAGTPPAEAEAHVQAEQLTHVLGADLVLEQIPGYGGQRTIILRPNDRLVLCSDGISKLLSLRELTELTLAHPPDQAANQLVQRALRNGSKDNLTALVIHCAPATPPIPQFVLWILVAVVLLALIGGGTAVAQTWLGATSTTPPSVNPLNTVTPLPPTATGLPSPTIDPALTPEPTSTGGPSITPTATPTNTPTLTPSPTNTRITVRSVVPTLLATSGPANPVLPTNTLPDTNSTSAPSPTNPPPPTNTPRSPDTSPPPPTPVPPTPVPPTPLPPPTDAPPTPLPPTDVPPTPLPPTDVPPTPVPPPTNTPVPPPTIGPGPTNPTG